jgi:hypothetical protein
MIAAAMSGTLDIIVYITRNASPLTIFVIFRNAIDAQYVLAAASLLRKSELDDRSTKPWVAELGSLQSSLAANCLFGIYIGRPRWPRRSPIFVGKVPEGHPTLDQTPKGMSGGFLLSGLHYSI